METVKDSPEIVRFDLATAFHGPGKMNVTVETSMVIHLKDTGLFCDDFPVENVLATCKGAVTHIVDVFAKKFFGE